MLFNGNLVLDNTECYKLVLTVVHKSYEILNIDSELSNTSRH